MNISWADSNCSFLSFPFYLFNFHGGICGRGAFIINVLCTYFLCPAIYPVYFFSLTCLSLSSTVEKEPQILGQTQKCTNNHTRQTHTHACTRTFSLQYSLTVQPSISGKRLEMHCGVLSGWTEHSWQQAVCLSADRSISSGWRTDRWGLCGVMSREKRLKTASSPEKEPPVGDERFARTIGNTRSHTQDRHLFTLFRFSVKLPKIN